MFFTFFLHWLNDLLKYPPYHVVCVCVRDSQRIWSLQWGAVKSHNKPVQCLDRVA